MKVEAIVSSRNITEVLHFTTHQGLLGILYSEFVKPRISLPKEVDLEHIYLPNAPYRKDTDWLGYVNLSISRINYHFFGHSCRRQREIGLWWCILAFKPVILSHEGVMFTTTNNIYSDVRRGEGGSGLEALFAPEIKSWNPESCNPEVVRRDAQCPKNHTTCAQAEVLYRGDLSIEYLDRIYIERGEDEDEVHAQLGAIQRSNVSTTVAPEMFRRTPAPRNSNEKF